METTNAQGIDYSAVLADLEKKRDDLDKAIASIRLLMLGYPGGVPASVGDQNVATTNTETKVGDHAFFGMSISKAAEKYLSMRKKPATAPEIGAALEQGGFPSQAENLVGNVTSALTRNAKGASSTFVKVKRGTWGLRAWYPNYRPKEGKDED